MRDVYYQSVGNPVQWERLPATRPAIELLSPPSAKEVRLKQIAVILTVASTSTLLVLIAWRPPGWSWLEPFDLSYALLVLAGGSIHAAISRRLAPLWSPLVLVAVALVALNHRTPWIAQVLLAATAFALLTYGLGLHGCHLLTAAPDCSSGFASADSPGRYHS